MAYRYRYDEEERYIPPRKLEENRNFWKVFLLNFVTLGIYSIVYFISFSFDLDKAIPRRDGGKTMNFVFAWLLSLFTMSIVMCVWHGGVASRVSDAMAERGLDDQFSMSDFWLWYVVGSLILVGPYIYLYKLTRAMNTLCKEYNEKQEAIERERPATR